MRTQIIFPRWHGPLQPYARADRGEKFIYSFIIKKKTYLSPQY